MGGGGENNTKDTEISQKPREQSRLNIEQYHGRATGKTVNMTEIELNTSICTFVINMPDAHFYPAHNLIKSNWPKIVFVGSIISNISYLVGI